jgi:ABC-2 type transport system permease protein
MAILFVFFTLAFGVRTALAERRFGMTARLGAAPIRPGLILAGKILSTTLLALSSMVVMWLSTWLLFGAQWGSPLGVVALSLATVLAAMAIATVIVTLAGSDQEAESYTALVTFALALIGGNFVRLYALPQGLQTATRSTPNGWALAGFVELVVGNGGVASVMLDAGVVLLFAAVFGVVAARRANRLLAP